MKFTDIKKDQLFEFQPEGRGAVYEVLKTDEGNSGDYKWKTIMLGNVNSKKIVSVPFDDFCTDDWMLLDGYKFEVQYEKVKYLILPDGERLVLSKSLCEEIKGTLEPYGSLKNVKPPKQTVSKGIKKILYQQTAKQTAVSHALAQAVEQVEPVPEEKAEPKQEFEYRDLTRIRTLKYDDMDLLGKIYVTCDPEYALARADFRNKKSELIHEQLLDMFRTGDMNMYDLRLRSYKMSKKTDPTKNISYHMLLLRLGKAIYKKGTSQEKKEFGINE